MSTTQQAKRSRKKAKIDPRYAIQARRDPVKRAERQRKLVEGERLRKFRKKK